MTMLLVAAGFVVDAVFFVDEAFVESSPPQPAARRVRSRTAQVMRRRGCCSTPVAWPASRPSHKAVPINVWQFLVDHRADLWEQGRTHARLVTTALLVAIPPAVALGIATFRRP